MKTIVLLITFIFCSISLAGPGGGHSHGHGHSHRAPAINATQAQEKGQYHVKKLIKAKKIGTTWESAVFDKAEKKMFKKKMEWVVTFTNEKGVKGKKLFIFLQQSGEFVAANFTGK